MLKADHREVEAWFEQFEATDSAPEKKKLANDICAALRLHTQLEEEVFYPACRQAGISEDLMDEADIEHEVAKRLIVEIEAGGPGDDHWEARVKVLSELIEHHIKEEEDRHEGIFAHARNADLDLEDLAGQLTARKSALLKQA